MIVIALIGILLSTGTLQFSDYIRKGAIERQTQELYSDLMLTRTLAVTQRIPKRVDVTPTVFRFVSSSLGGGVSSGSVTRVLSKPITWTGKGSSTEKQIIFDERGTFNIDVIDGNTTICVEPSFESAQYDSIVVFSAMIYLGKVVFGGECKSDNVTVK
jgi:Tfp pilus assembly protein FimT